MALAGNRLEGCLLKRSNPHAASPVARGGKNCERVADPGWLTDGVIDPGRVAVSVSGPPIDIRQRDRPRSPFNAPNCLSVR